jgi:hypothetical protein
MKRELVNWAMWIGIGVALGAGTGHMATWIAVGAGMAVAMGTSQHNCAKKCKEQK